MLITPEPAIFYRLATHPGVARIVGFKIFPVAVPQEDDNGNEVTFPFIVYRRPNNRREHTLSGPIFEPSLSIQVASWASTFDEARELGDQVRLALNGHAATIGPVTIHSMRLSSEIDDYLDQAEVGAQLPPAYEVRQLYAIDYTESST